MPAGAAHLLGERPQRGLRPRQRPGWRHFAGQLTQRVEYLQLQSVTRSESTDDQPRLGQPPPEIGHSTTIGVTQAGRAGSFLEQENQPRQASLAGRQELQFRVGDRFTSHD